MASYRYRCLIPSQELGLKINDFSRDILVFSKPTPTDVSLAKLGKMRGKKIVVDICDDHLELDHYRAMLDMSDRVTCPTEVMAKRLRWAEVIEDPYEYPQCHPHMKGDNLLWFGHPSNLKSIRGRDFGHPLRVVSSGKDVIQWSPEIMRDEFRRADIVVIPHTQSYKSPNRAVEAIRQGCFVVAERHPSLQAFPVYQGDIKEGIEWALKYPDIANQMTAEAQGFVSKRFSPKTVASAWKKLFQELASTLDAEKSAGTVGST